MTAVRSTIERGTVLLGKYIVESIIGRGGMGLVVKAWHLGLDEQVAIKMLRDDVAMADETIARFIREAQAAVKLKSEHIARITDVGMLDTRRPYLVMEYLEGQDIGQLLVERGRLQSSLAIDLVIQACEALAEAHSLGIVHRDIKPSNLFLTSHPDGTLLLKILDFGISKAPSGAELSLTQTWSLLGTPAYMSPEQMRSARNVDARTDVWSLGAVLYEVLEGHLPFQAESFSEMCVMVAIDPPAPMSATPRELAPIVARCLAKNPDERYPDVAALARDLARLAREPDKAHAIVDRMHRMMERAAIRRTPAAGVPFALGSAHHERPSVALPAPRASDAERVSAALPAARSVRASRPTPAPGPQPSEIAPYAMPASAPGLAASRASHPTPPAYPPLPVTVDDAGSLRPALPRPGGAPSRAEGSGSSTGWGPRNPLARVDPSGLLTTHQIARRDRSWLVATTAALVALAAGLAVVAAIRSGQATGSPADRADPDSGSEVVRMAPTPATSSVPAAGAPTSSAGMR